MRLQILPSFNFVISRFFSIYFTITGVKKSVAYSKSVAYRRWEVHSRLLTDGPFIDCASKSDILCL